MCLFCCLYTKNIEKNLYISTCFSVKHTKNILVYTFDTGSCLHSLSVYSFLLYIIYIYFYPFRPVWKIRRKKCRLYILAVFFFSHFSSSYSLAEGWKRLPTRCFSLSTNPIQILHRLSRPPSGTSHHQHPIPLSTNALRSSPLSLPHFNHYQSSPSWFSTVVLLPLVCHDEQKKNIWGRSKKI